MWCFLFSVVNEIWVHKIFKSFLFELFILWQLFRKWGCMMDDNTKKMTYTKTLYTQQQDNMCYAAQCYLNDKAVLEVYFPSSHYIR